MTDATWTTFDEYDELSGDDIKRDYLVKKANKQKIDGLVSWGGYIFHVYEEIAEDHRVEFSEYPVPGQSSLGYRVQNKINLPSEVVFKAMMVTTGVVSAKYFLSAPYKNSFELDVSSFLDVFPWVSFPIGVSGIIKKLKEAMYKGWALPYNGKYGRINNMAIKEIKTLDNEKTVYGVPIELHLKQVLGINHRAATKKVSVCVAPIALLPDLSGFK